MPELDGIEVARALIAETQPCPAIVFVTAHDDRAVDAFEVSAVDYLVKPVLPYRLHTTLARLKNRSSATQVKAMERFLTQETNRAEHRRFSVKVGAKHIVIDPSEILAVTAQDHYALIRLADHPTSQSRPPREVLADHSIDWVEKQLVPDPRFLRVHRSVQNFLIEAHPIS